MYRYFLIPLDCMLEINIASLTFEHTCKPDLGTRIAKGKQYLQVCLCLESDGTIPLRVVT